MIEYTNFIELHNSYELLAIAISILAEVRSRALKFSSRINYTFCTVIDVTIALCV